jgi:tetratricopeptide (TPR) repeat protein
MNIPNVSAYELDLLVWYKFSAYCTKGDHREAIRTFENMTKSKTTLRERDYWQLLVAKILGAYEASGDCHGAVKAFEIIIEWPNSEGNWAWPALLKAYTLSGNINGGIQRFERAIFDDQTELSAQLCYAGLDIYQTKGDSEGAIKMFNKIVHVLPLEAWSWHVLADAYRLKSDYTNAIQVYHSALQYISIDYSFHKCLCDLYVVTADCRKALEYYDRAMELAPRTFLWEYVSIRPLSHDAEVPIDESLRNHFLWVSVGEAFQALGESSRAHDIYDEVRQRYQSALQHEDNELLKRHAGLNPLDGCLTVLSNDRGLPVTIIWWAIGEACKGKGDPDGALEAFQKAMELEPENVWLQRMVLEMGNIINHNGDYY